MTRKFQRFNQEKLPHKSVKMSDAIALIDHVDDWIEIETSEHCMTYMGSTRRNGGWGFELMAYEENEGELSYQGFVVKGEASTTLSPVEAQNAFYVARKSYLKSAGG